MRPTSLRGSRRLNRTCQGGGVRVSADARAPRASEDVPTELRDGERRPTGGMNR